MRAIVTTKIIKPASPSNRASIKLENPLFPVQRDGYRMLLDIGNLKAIDVIADACRLAIDDCQRTRRAEENALHMDLVKRTDRPFLSGHR